MTAIDLVKGCPLFYELYDDEVEKLINSCLVATFNPGDKIVRQGEEGSEIFVILVGLVGVVVQKEKASAEIAELKKGDIFGELVLLNQTRRTADIICKTAVDVLVIDYEVIFSLFKKNNKVFSVLILNLARLLTKRLKGANEVIESMKKI